VTVPGIQVSYTTYLGRNARGHVTISTRLETLKPRPQQGGVELGLDPGDYSTLGVIICWLLWGLYYQRVAIYISHGIPAGGSKLPLPRITIGGRHYELGGSSGIAP